VSDERTYGSDEHTYGNAGEPRPGVVAEIDRLLNSALDAAEKGAVLSDGWFSAMSMLTVDAALAADREALRLAREGLYDVAATLAPRSRDPLQLVAGRLTAIADVAESALFRAAPVFAAAELEPGSWAHRMLRHVADHPACRNIDVEQALGQVDATEVSRCGRKLLELGVVVRRRLGRKNRWSITPRGTSVLAATAETPKDANRLPIGTAHLDKKEPGGARLHTQDRPRAPYLAKLNEAFPVGGPALLVQLVENLSGLRIYHSMTVDFAGFKHMVDALGGVTLCVNTTRHPDSGYMLTKGVHPNVTGEDALAFVRDRKGLPNGDLDRIRDQQYFPAHAILTAATGNVTVGRPVGTFTRRLILGDELDTHVQHPVAVVGPDGLHKPGDRVTIHFTRDGAAQTTTVTMGSTKR
jgi:LCP family protein required for cell wall assembly